jgi:hypothetical protein
MDILPSVIMLNVILLIVVAPFSKIKNISFLFSFLCCLIVGNKFPKLSDFRQQAFVTDAIGKMPSYKILSYI